MIELVLAALFGVGLGLFAGLLPGIHPNSMIPILLGLSAALDPATATVILVTAGVVNSFVSFIPAILTGAPEDAESLSALPGHKMLMAGKGYEAVKLTALGGLYGAFLGIGLLPVLWILFPPLYAATRPWLHLILSTVIVYMILTETKLVGKLFAAVTLALSGVLGVLTLNSFGNAFLFPMLTGLFGVPLLLISLKQRVSIPSSISYETERLPARITATGAVAGAAGGILVGLLPGIGSSQAAVLAQEVTGKINENNMTPASYEPGTKSMTAKSGRRSPSPDKAFLIAIGGITTADVIYSLLALWLVGNPRSGIAVAVEQLVSVTPQLLMLLLASILFAAGAGAYLTMRLTRMILPLLRKIDYQRLNASIIVLLFILVGLFTGPLGLLVATVATSIGLVPNLTGIRRSHAMGCLLLPTILFFAGL